MKEITPKQLALYEATLALVAEGNAPHELTISRIAAKAGIGKGTVYEYFDSKEALFAGAVAYRAQQEAEELEETLNSCTRFTEAFCRLAGQIRGWVQNPLSSFRLTVTQFSSKEVVPLPEKERLCRQNQENLDALLDRFFAMGKAEGLIGPDVDREAAVMAVEGAFFAFILPPFPHLSRQEQADRAVALLLKSLA